MNTHGRARARFLLAMAASTALFAVAYAWMPSIASKVPTPKVAAFVAVAPPAELADSGTTIDLAELLAETNRERASVNVAPLQPEAGLYLSAKNKCADMAEKHYFGHYAPGGQSGLAFIEEIHPGYAKIGENLAFGYNDASEVVAGWSQSTSHRQAMLNPNYKYVGYAVCETTDEEGATANSIVQHLMSL